MDENNLSARADQLVRAVADLSDSITDLMERTELSAHKIKRSRNFAQATAVGLVLDVVLTVVIVFVFNRQQAVNSDVLCPLYGVFIGSLDNTRRTSMTPEQQARFDHAVSVVTHGADVLGCDS